MHCSIQFAVHICFNYLVSQTDSEDVKPRNLLQKNLIKEDGNGNEKD